MFTIIHFNNRYFIQIFNFSIRTSKLTNNLPGSNIYTSQMSVKIMTA